MPIDLVDQLSQYEKGSLIATAPFCVVQLLRGLQNTILYYLKTLLPH
jgi:hypothetical protein